MYLSLNGTKNVNDHAEKIPNIVNILDTRELNRAKA